MDGVLVSLGVNDLFKLVRDKLDQGRGIYTDPLPKLLKSTANAAGKPCKEQEAHYDYKVRANVRKEELPMSCLIALHGNSTHVVLFVKYSEKEAYHKIHVLLNPGYMIIFDGYTLHCGGMYRRTNLRLFSFFPTRKYQPSDVVVFDSTWENGDLFTT